MSFLVRCPNCGERSVYDFRFGGEVKARPAPEASPEEWTRYRYAKQNEAGEQLEWWYHRLGCRQWFIARRNTVTNVVSDTRLP